jgi:hypothetical protein
MGIDEHKAELIDALDRKAKEIQYYTFLTNLLKRPDDVRAYEKRLTEMSLRATAKIDSVETSGEKLVADAAEIKAVRRVVRDLLSDLVHAEANHTLLNDQYMALAAELKTLDIPKKTSTVKYRPPEK